MNKILGSVKKSVFLLSIAVLFKKLVKMQSF